MSLGLVAFDQGCVSWGLGALVADIPLQLCCEVKFKYMTNIIFKVNVWLKLVSFNNIYEIFEKKLQ